MQELDESVQAQSSTTEQESDQSQVTSEQTTPRNRNFSTNKRPAENSRSMKSLGVMTDADMGDDYDRRNSTNSEPVKMANLEEIFARNILRTIKTLVSLKWIHILVSTTMCTLALISAVLYTGITYTPIEDACVYCVVYALWITVCLPWLVVNVDGKLFFLIIGALLRLFGADIGVMAWAYFKGYREVLHRGLRLKPIFEPSMSWLSEAGYNLRNGVILASLLSSLLAFGINVVQRILEGTVEEEDEEDDEDDQYEGCSPGEKPKRRSRIPISNHSSPRKLSATSNILTRSAKKRLQIKPEASDFLSHSLDHQPNEGKKIHKSSDSNFNQAEAIRREMETSEEEADVTTMTNPTDENSENACPTADKETDKSSKRNAGQRAKIKKLFRHFNGTKNQNRKSQSTTRAHVKVSLDEAGKKQVKSGSRRPPANEENIKSPKDNIETIAMKERRASVYRRRSRSSPAVSTSRATKASDRGRSLSKEFTN